MIFQKSPPGRPGGGHPPDPPCLHQILATSLLGCLVLTRLRVAFVQLICPAVAQPGRTIPHVCFSAHANLGFNEFSLYSKRQAGTAVGHQTSSLCASVYDIAGGMECLTGVEWLDQRSMFKTQNIVSEDLGFG